MTIVTESIRFAKKLKHRFQDALRAGQKVYLSPVRRIERVAADSRVCAMTFDDGPCRLPAYPEEGGEGLTLTLLRTLEKYGAKGTFDVIGDTSENYPDTRGKTGSAQWSGVSYDHYPDFGKDADGGAANCPELIGRILSGGHEITSHTYRHVLFGKKPLVYGSRKPLEGLDAVTEDLRRLHTLLQERYGYTIRLSRPPHYVDRTKDGFSAYDAYALMGYQYMAASFDGAGWLPLAEEQAEVEAMIDPIEKALRENPDALRGQIIFQKDGYNMARRAPVAKALDRQLALLTERGYRVITVSELLNCCPFADVSPKDPCFGAAKKLLDAGFCVCYRDNTVRPGAILTRAELAMLVFGGQTAARRVEIQKQHIRVCRDVSAKHPYAAAIERAMTVLPPQDGKFRPDAPAGGQELAALCESVFGNRPEADAAQLTHGEAILLLAREAEEHGKTGNDK